MSSREIPEQGLQQFPELAFASLKFGPSTVRDSGLPHVRDSTSSPNQNSRTLHIREFKASQVSGFREL
jgi:hypothetical protein